MLSFSLVMFKYLLNINLYPIQLEPIFNQADEMKYVNINSNHGNFNMKALYYLPIELQGKKSKLLKMNMCDLNVFLK